MPFSTSVLKYTLLVGQYHACTKKPTAGSAPDLIESHIASCLKCREELRKVCKEVGELIAAKTTKKLG